MAMNVDAVLRLGAKVDGLNSIVAFNRGLQSVETTAKGVTGAMRGMTGAAAGLSGALGTLAPLLSVAGLVGMVQNTIKAGDAMYDLSQRTGVSVQALAQFKKAAATSGTDIDNVAKSLNILNKGMLEVATTGKGKVADGLKMLGLSAFDARGKLKSADQVTLEVANRFKNMANDGVKAGIAMKLFGRNGAEMVPMLNMGGDAISSLSVKMTEAFAKKADEYSDKLAILSGKVGALGADLTIALLPALQSITDAVTAAVTAFNALPDPIQNLAVGGASLAVAWGPITGILSAVAGGVKLLGVAVGGVIEYVAAAGLSLEGLAVMATDAGFALASIPVAGWAAAAVAGLAALSVALYQNSEGFRNWANTSLNFIKVLANDGMNTMRSFGQRLSSMWSGLVSTAKGVGRGIASAFSGPFGVIATVAKSVFDFVAQKIQGLYNLLPAGVRKAIGGVGSYFQGAWNKAAGMSAGGGGGNVDAGGGDTTAFNPNLSGTGSNSKGSKSKDEKKEIDERIRASGEALLKSKAQLAILKQIDPLEKIQLEYAEKKRSINAAAKKELAESKSARERSNIEAAREADLDKLDIERKNELIQKFKDLKGAGFEAAGSLEQWYTGVDKNNTAMAGLRDGITSYIERIGSLREQVSQLSGQLLQTVEGSLSTAISSAVSNFASGAESIQQTLSDLFKSIGDAFIKMASEIIAQQLMMAAFNAILGITGGGSLINKASGLNKTVGFGAGTFTGFATGGVMSSNGVVPLKRYADGGVANSPQVAMFGERGPEAYVPLPDGRTIPVKISGAMDRYRPGAVGAASAGDTEQAMGSDGNGPVDGAIDVRYTVERINNVEYVTAEQFQIGMRQAANQGASQGERRALKTLQASRSVRNRVGLR